MTHAMTVQNKKNIRRNRKGFTLIELIVVIAILAILAAIAIPAFSGTLNKAKESSDNATLRVLQSAVRLYEAENGVLPGSEAELDPYLDGVVGEKWPTPAQSDKEFIYDADDGVVTLDDKTNP